MDTSPSTPALRKLPRWVIILAFIALLAFLALIYGALTRSLQGPLNIGDSLRQFSVTSFNGQVVNTADYNGKVIVINFWASWCIPCENEAAFLEKAWEKYQDDGQVLFLGLDYADTEPEAKAYLQKYNITYLNGPDLGTRISHSFRMTGVPETYFFDRNGKLAYKQFGEFTSANEITAIIDGLIK
jgi:cytochrome c biogenesis protein CcmG, thiol:disulfide interchange protein DsbE